MGYLWLTNNTPINKINNTSIKNFASDTTSEILCLIKISFVPDGPDVGETHLVTGAGSASRLIRGQYSPSGPITAPATLGHLTHARSVCCESWWCNIIMNQSWKLKMKIICFRRKFWFLIVVCTNFMWNCTISKYSFHNLNEIVWKKSEKFGYEAQPSIQIFHDFWRLFHENSEKSTRMSAISDKQHNLTELSMHRCCFWVRHCTL